MWVLSFPRNCLHGTYGSTTAPVTVARLCWSFDRIVSKTPRGDVCGSGISQQKDFCLAQDRRRPSRSAGRIFRSRAWHSAGGECTAATRPEFPIPEPPPAPVKNPHDVPVPPITDPDVVEPGEAPPTYRPGPPSQGEAQFDKPDAFHLAMPMHRYVWKRLKVSLAPSRSQSALSSPS